VLVDRVCALVMSKVKKNAGVWVGGLYVGVSVMGGGGGKRFGVDLLRELGEVLWGKCGSGFHIMERDKRRWGYNPTGNFSRLLCVKSDPMIWRLVPSLYSRCPLAVSRSSFGGHVWSEVVRSLQERSGNVRWGERVRGGCFVGGMGRGGRG